MPLYEARAQLTPEERGWVEVAFAPVALLFRQQDPNQGLVWASVRAVRAQLVEADARLNSGELEYAIQTLRTLARELTRLAGVPRNALAAPENVEAWREQAGRAERTANLLFLIRQDLGMLESLGAKFSAIPLEAP